MQQKRNFVSELQCESTREDSSFITESIFKLLNFLRPKSKCFVISQHIINIYYHCRQVTERYVLEARKVLDELLQALAEALSLERNVFVKYFDPTNSEINVRVNYYPPCPRPDLAQGITPHSDASALTLLMQFDATGGLQVLRDQKWLTLPWPTDALLVNVGDFLEIMSNGRLKSPWHRVVTQMEVERFSVALFYNPPSWTEIVPEPVEDSAGQDGGGGFRKVLVGDYLKHFYEISPTEDKQAIMYARV